METSCGNDGSMPHTTSLLSVDEIYEVQCCYCCDQMRNLFVNEQYIQVLLMKPIAISLIVLNSSTCLPSLLMPRLSRAFHLDPTYFSRISNSLTGSVHYQSPLRIAQLSSARPEHHSNMLKYLSTVDVKPRPLGPFRQYSHHDRV